MVIMQVYHHQEMIQENSLGRPRIMDSATSIHQIRMSPFWMKRSWIVRVVFNLGGDQEPKPEHKQKPVRSTPLSNNSQQGNTRDSGSLRRLL